MAKEKEDFESKPTVLCKSDIWSKCVCGGSVGYRHTYEGNRKNIIQIGEYIIIQSNFNPYLISDIHILFYA